MKTTTAAARERARRVSRFIIADANRKRDRDRTETEIERENG